MSSEKLAHGELPKRIQDSAFNWDTPTSGPGTACSFDHLVDPPVSPL